MQNMDNLGSFGAAAGGVSPELQAAIQRRPSNGSPMNAVTTSAPTFNPNTQPPTPIQSTPNPSQPMQATLSNPETDSETRQIIKALEGRLKTLSKIEEMRGGF